MAKEDVVVPRAKIPELFDSFGALESKYGVEIVAFGHIGDGNVHVNIIAAKTGEAEWQKISQTMLEELFSRVIALGGALSGEHGIGCVKNRFMPLALDAAALDVMRRIKTAVDGDGVLNPGKIF
jgi:FAD/FMN-containing dehydrogenase